MGNGEMVKRAIYEHLLLLQGKNNLASHQEFGGSFQSFTISPHCLF